MTIEVIFLIVWVCENYFFIVCIAQWPVFYYYSIFCLFFWIVITYAGVSTQIQHIINTFTTELFHLPKNFIYSFQQLVETVSCGGNLLMNIGPTHDGTISVIFEERLRQIGTWLKVNGEAIYETHPWRSQSDDVTPNVW